jgi:hypothetical protein
MTHTPRRSSYIKCLRLFLLETRVHLAQRSSLGDNELICIPELMPETCHGSKKSCKCRWGSKVDAVPDDADAEALLLHQVPRAVSLWETRVHLAQCASTAPDRKAQLEDLQAPDTPSDKEIEATVAGLREIAGERACEAVALARCNVLLLLPPVVDTVAYNQVLLLPPALAMHARAVLVICAGYSRMHACSAVVAGRRPRRQWQI